MKAVLFDQESTLRLREVPDPVLGDRDVLVQVSACGICASDLHLAAITAGITEISYPLVAGHEIAGTVVQVGSAVENVAVGDPIVVHPVVYCGACHFCHTGHPNLCQHPQVIGLHRAGGFAEHVAVPAQNAYPSGDLDPSAAACVEPLACALHGLARVQPRVADSVLILGTGTIGLLFLQLIRRRGAGSITAVDLQPHRLDVARQLGADQAILSGDDLPAKLLELAPLGFDCVVDATGVPEVVELAHRHVAPAGQLLMLGSCPADATITVRPRLIQRHDVTTVGAYSFGFEFAPALALLQAGHVQTDPIVTHHYPLQAAADAFEQARCEPESIKIQIGSP